MFHNSKKDRPVKSLNIIQKFAEICSVFGNLLDVWLFTVESYIQVESTVSSYRHYILQDKWKHHKYHIQLHWKLRNLDNWGQNPFVSNSTILQSWYARCKTGQQQCISSRGAADGKSGSLETMSHSSHCPLSGTFFEKKNCLDIWCLNTCNHHIT